MIQQWLIPIHGEVLSSSSSRYLLYHTLQPNRNYPDPRHEGRTQNQGLVVSSQMVAYHTAIHLTANRMFNEPLDTSIAM
jgi:hypothetical protein